MSERSEQLIGIRPAITIEQSPQNDIEAFQANTLRSILKLQNPALLLIAKNHLTHKYKNFVGQSLTDKKQKIEESLKGDQGLKKLLLGTIIGHFTEDELEFYFQHEAAINKRLLVFIYKRITDQMNYFS